MEEVKVAERRYRNLLKKSLPHIDLDKTDVFEKLGFAHVKQESPGKSLFFQGDRKMEMLNQATQNLKRKYIHGGEASHFLHKLPKVIGRKQVNISDTFSSHSNKENVDYNKFMDRLHKERESIR